MRNNPEMTISRPLPADGELLSAISEMRISLESNGMVWAEFEKDDKSGNIVARGWSTGPDQSSG